MPPAGPINVADFEPIARDRMEPAAWDYFAGGADDERTLADNLDAFRRLRLRPRMLVDVTRRSLAVTALGAELAMPIIVAPTAARHFADPDGDLAVARGAAVVGALTTLSTISDRSLEDVVDAAPDAPRWFQLYASSDEAITRGLLDRASKAGYGAVVVTVDLPYAGNRERDARSGFVVPLGVHLPEEQPVDEHGLLIAPTFDWDWLAWLRSVCSVPLLAKGILRADDALRALEAGCAGVWVSNHGGRQLDGAVTAVDALPEIVAAVGERGLIVADGGVRRGTDALKLLALGADLVGVGRPILWGLAAGGADGVQRVLEILRDELSLAMALSGCRSVAEITPDLVVSVG
jgi:4-hydroxymandelate oxidase